MIMVRYLNWQTVFHDSLKFLWLSHSMKSKLEQVLFVNN